MNPDPRDNDLEREFLEQNLRNALQDQDHKDLADAVRLVMEAEDQEGDEMTTLTAEPTWAIDTEKPKANTRKLWTYLVNAACFVAISFLISTTWKNYYEPIPESGNAELTPLTQDQDEIEDHNEDPRPVEVRSLKDVHAIVGHVKSINAAGKDVTDEVVIEICRTQPQLTHLELRRCWVTGRGMQEVRRLTNLQSLSLPWNQYIDQSGWMVIGDLKEIRSLNVAVFVGQTAAMRVDGQETPQPPKEGIQAGPFMIPAICALPKLTHLDVSGFNMKPIDMLALSQGVAKSLSAVDISFTRVDSSCIAFFATCENLRSVRAVGVATKDKLPLTNFVLFKNLTSLTIGASGMSSVTYDQTQLEVLLAIETLQTLEFVSVNFDPDQIGRFVGQVKWRKRGKKGIRSLRFNYCFGLSDKVCQDLVNMPALQAIAMINCKGITTTGLVLLAKSKATHVDVRGSVKQIDADQVKAVLSEKPTLSIRVRKTAKIMQDFQGFIEEDRGDWGVILKAQRTK